MKRNKMMQVNKSMTNQSTSSMQLPTQLNNQRGMQMFREMISGKEMRKLLVSKHHKPSSTVITEVEEAEVVVEAAVEEAVTEEVTVVIMMTISMAVEEVAVGATKAMVVVAMKGIVVEVTKAILVVAMKEDTAEEAIAVDMAVEVTTMTNTLVAEEEEATTSNPEVEDTTRARAMFKETTPTMITISCEELSNIKCKGRGVQSLSIFIIMYSSRMIE